MESGQQEVIGGKNNFWLHSEADGWDLTHPPTPSSPAIYPRIPLATTSVRVAIDPAKTALVIIDLQNYFLSPSLGRPSDAIGLKVVDKLLEHAIPACRKAGIPIVWLGWGLTEQDIDEMPPTIVKGFEADNNFSGERRIKGLSSDIGSVRLNDCFYSLGGDWMRQGNDEKAREDLDAAIKSFTAATHREEQAARAISPVK